MEWPQLGINSWLCSTWDVEDAVRGAAEAGYGGVEINGFPQFFPRERRRGLLGLLSDAGLAASAVGTGVPFFQNRESLNLHSQIPEIRGRSVRYVKSCIDLAHDLGAKIVYVTSVAKNSPEVTPERAADLLVESLSDCADYASEVGVRIAVEHSPIGILETFRFMNGLVRGAGNASLGLLYDIGHIRLSGESVADSVKLGGEKIFHVHLDNNGGAKDDHWPPYQGSLERGDFQSLFTNLREIGYSGMQSVELLNLEDPLPTMIGSRTYIEEVRK